jgi:hypothetical protein
MFKILIPYFFVIAPVMAEVGFNLDKAMVLEKLLKEEYAELVEGGEIPSYLLSDIRGNDKSFHQLPMHSQQWLSQQQSENPRIATLYRSFDFLTGDDIIDLNTTLLLNYLRGQEVDILQKLRSIQLYWAERDTPTQTLSPRGLNKIIWAWQLGLDSREHGVLHVAIDTVTRDFVCYEHTIGIYYPEGKTLNRIYSEIVQHPEKLNLVKRQMEELNKNRKIPR